MQIYLYSKFILFIEAIYFMENKIELNSLVLTFVTVSAQQSIFAKTNIC